MYIFNAVICSSLEKVFPGDEELPVAIKSLTLLRRQKAAFQFIIRTNRTEEQKIEVVSSLPTKLFRVADAPSELAIPDDKGNSVVLNEGKPGMYPDILLPCNGFATTNANENTAFWIEINADKEGEHSVEITLTNNDVCEKFNLSITVADADMPAQTLKHINWFHSDCLANFYNVTVFDEDYWRIVENYMKNAREHGINVILTPLFTPPLDTEEGGERLTVQLVGVTKTRQTYEFDFSKLNRWIDTAQRCGIEYFEFSHMFTQWGAKHAPKIIADTLQGERKIFGWETKSDDDVYVNFLQQFGAALTKYASEKGITDRCYIHCSDEPGLTDKPRYKIASNMIREYFGAFRHIDALSDYPFYKSGLIEIPVPEEGSIEKFAGKVPELWTYYCCGQYKDNLPNRFMCMPSVKNRILGTLLYKYDCTGFLQWGYNFWNTQYSKKAINPYEVTDAGGAFSSGDSFIVYPGEDGTPVSSLRQKVFYDGIQDFEALKLLERLTSREEVLKLIEEKLGKINFTSYPFEASKLLELSQETVNRIAEAVK